MHRDAFLDVAAFELAEARRLYPSPFPSPEAALKVIAGELEDFRRAVNGEEDRDALRELASVAAMCIRTAEDLGLERRPSRT